MKIKQLVPSLAAIAVLMITSCSTPPPPQAVEEPAPIDMEALRTEIQAMEDAYAAAEQEKNAEGVAAYYSDDAISYVRNREPVAGKEAITARIAERLEKDTSNTTNVYKVVDLFADGDIAVEIGSWQEMDSTGTELSKGHYMSYFEKRDGKYICVRDMNVTSMPKEKNETEDME